MLPTAITVTGEEPEIAAKITQANTLASPRPPDSRPITARATPTSRSAMVPCVMMLPASTKNGIASSSSFFTDSYMSLATLRALMSWISVTHATEATPIARNSGAPVSTSRIAAIRIRVPVFMPSTAPMPSSRPGNRPATIRSAAPPFLPRVGTSRGVSGMGGVPEATAPDSGSSSSSPSGEVKLPERACPRKRSAISRKDRGMTAWASHIGKATAPLFCCTKAAISSAWALPPSGAPVSSPMSERMSWGLAAGAPPPSVAAAGASAPRGVQVSGVPSACTGVHRCASSSTPATSRVRAPTPSATARAGPAGKMPRRRA